jgi:hypothetical protein
VVVAVILIAAATLPALLAGPPGEGALPAAVTVPPAATPTVVLETTLPTVPTTIGRPVTSTVTATVQATTPVPGEAPIPAVTGTTAAVTCVPQGEPGFTVTVSPLEATAARGGTVTYHMTVEAQNCFSDAVTMKITASVLFFSQTYDLGTQEPPYPKSFEYPLTIPGSLFSGATVKGVLTSTGGGITRENQLTLHVS